MRENSTSAHSSVVEELGQCLEPYPLTVRKGRRGGGGLWLRRVALTLAAFYCFLVLISPTIYYKERNSRFHVAVARYTHATAIYSSRDWSYLDLSNIDVSGLDLTHLISMEKMRLQHAKLSRANLSGVNLYNSSLYRADLSGSNIEGAHLAAARFAEANLRGADLRNADMRGAWVICADLRGANLDGALFEDAVYSATTKWPQGFDPARRGARMVPAENRLGEAD